MSFALLILFYHQICNYVKNRQLQNPNESEELDLDPWNDPNAGAFGSKPVNLAPGEFPSPRKKCMSQLVLYFKIKFIM